MFKRRRGAGPAREGGGREGGEDPLSHRRWLKKTIIAPKFLVFVCSVLRSALAFVSCSWRTNSSFCNSSASPETSGRPAAARAACISTKWTEIESDILWVLSKYFVLIAASSTSSSCSEPCESSPTSLSSPAVFFALWNSKKFRNIRRSNKHGISFSLTFFTRPEIYLQNIASQSPCPDRSVRLRPGLRAASLPEGRPCSLWAASWLCCAPLGKIWFSKLFLRKSSEKWRPKQTERKTRP